MSDCGILGCEDDAEFVLYIRDGEDIHEAYRCEEHKDLGGGVVSRRTIQDHA